MTIVGRDISRRPRAYSAYILSYQQCKLPIVAADSALSASVLVVEL